jgi:5-methylcytosine-specific restriction endonuclease McrA
LKTMAEPIVRKAVLYGRRWNAARARFLQDNPLCVFCSKQGKTVAGVVVDHTVPHRLDPVLFWDISNWQSLCQPCHDEVKQRQERTGLGFSTAIGLDGWPTDQMHPLYGRTGGEQ